MLGERPPLEELSGSSGSTFLTPVPTYALKGPSILVCSFFLRDGFAKEELYFLIEQFYDPLWNEIGNKFYSKLQIDQTPKYVANEDSIPTRSLS